MSNRTEFKSIKNFLFQKDKTFIIPNYQRGYKWAVKENNKQSAVEKLIEDLRNANKQQEYFLQGVTVSEEDNKIILIDGQQRTTTLYLLLWALQYEKFKEINLQYDIREKSKEFINKLKVTDFDYQKFDEENKVQDVFYFKEAIKQIKREIDKVENRAEFLNFLLDKVTIIYIVIDKDKATKTFTMMNGAKATMLQEELVKAEMLRRISIPEEDKQVFDIDKVNLSEIELGDLKEIITKDWETNALRSRYAREWDKWLYWWNRNDVKEYFNIKSPMGLLLDYFYKRKKDDKDAKFSFDNFKGLITENKKTGKQKTKLIFKELRDLQKSFEDIFNFPKIYNYLKLALICSADGKDKFEIINYFINNKKNEELLANYSKWRMVGATHSQITSNNLSEYKDKAQIALNNLSDDFVYQNAYDIALKQLLRLNVEEDNKLFDGKGRKFDFTIYGNKSLEHIHPKSKVYHKNEEEKLVDGNNNLLNEEKTKYETDETWLNREDFNKNGTEHCIGNLVLLDKNENSKFNDKPFEEKKEIYFNVNEGFKSRNLLHTISVFAKSKWGIEDIQRNKEEFIERFKKDYNIKD